MPIYHICPNKNEKEYLKKCSEVGFQSIESHKKTRIEENSALSKSQLSHDKWHKNQKVAHSFSTHIYDIQQDGRQGSPNMFSVYLKYYNYDISICQNDIFF